MLHLRPGVLRHAIKGMFYNQMRIYNILICVFLWTYILKILMLMLTIGRLPLVTAVHQQKQNERKENPKMRNRKSWEDRHRISHQDQYSHGFC